MGRAGLEPVPFRTTHTRYQRSNQLSHELAYNKLILYYIFKNYVGLMCTVHKIDFIGKQEQINLL